MPQIEFTGTAGADLLDASGLAAGSYGVLRGGAGADTLLGSAGNDRFEGGAGADSMFGGGGADQFFIVRDNAYGGARDTVDGGTGHDQIVIAVNSAQLTDAFRLEVWRLKTFLADNAVSPGGRFVSDILHLDMTNVESGAVRLDGVLKSLDEIDVHPIDFEDVTTGAFASIPDGYRGFNWHGPSTHLGVVDATFYPQPGYINGQIDPGGHVAFNAQGATPVDITRHDGGIFRFEQVYLTASHRTDQEIRVEGLLNGVQVGVVELTLDTQAPTLVRGGWGEIDDLRITTLNPTVTVPVTLLDHIAMDHFLMA
ncbi:MAG: hypothetical protein ACOYOH_07570 [Paracraurococcus sp.]